MHGSSVIEKSLFEWLTVGDQNGGIMPRITKCFFEAEP
jgi:hypothetical protein